jgi:hypothetical protein
MDKAVAELDSIWMIFVQSIESNDEFQLRIVLAEGHTGSPASDEEIHAAETETLKIVLQNTSPVIVTEKSRVFEVAWKHVISYMVTDEMIGHSMAGVSEGRILSHFSESAFLVFGKQNLTNWTPELGLQHFQVSGTDRLVDVLAHETPTVRRIDHLPPTPEATIVEDLLSIEERLASSRRFVAQMRNSNQPLES